MRARSVFSGVVVAACATSTPGRADCVQIPRGVVSWWPGDGNALDLVGGNPGALVNGAGFGAGAVGQAFSLDGIDDFVRILDAPSLDFGTGDFSVGLWARTSFVGGTQNDFLISKASVGFDQQYLLLYAAAPALDRSAAFVMGDGVSANAIARSPFAIGDGQFHHLVGVRRGLLLQLYVDGRPVAASTMPSPFSASSANNVVIGGRDNPANDPYFNGTIDEVQILGRALTSCEVRAVFQAGSDGQCKGDSDADGLSDYEDNCPYASNAVQQDGDGDGAGDECDCAPSDPGTFATPPEVCELRLGENADPTAAAWTSVELAAGPAAVYDLLRGRIGELPVGSGAGEACAASGLAALGTADPTVPAPRSALWYLVRARNACGTGTYGRTSGGLGRLSPACP